jgi:hypothetical protein|nr:MAG TPA: hypothetical protein [Crassvirales sp.]
MTKKCNRLRGERPKAFWGALVGGAMNLIGSAISSKSQARAIRRQIEAQKEAARTQLELANNSNLASTLNSYATATRSYNDEDDYNLKYRLGGNKRLGSNRIYITDGGNATKIGNDTYLLRGGSHEQTNETGQTGIGINVGGNEVEAEGGEVAQKKNGALRIFSAQPILGNGMSPAQAILRGYNKDSIFKQQQAFKKRNGLKDDGTKQYRPGGEVPYNHNDPTGLFGGSPHPLAKIVDISGVTSYGDVKKLINKKRRGETPTTLEYLGALSAIPAIGRIAKALNLIGNVADATTFMKDVKESEAKEKAYQNEVVKYMDIHGRIKTGRRGSMPYSAHELRKRLGGRAKARIGTEETYGDENKTNITTSNLNGAEYLSKIISGAIMQGGRLLTGNARDKSASNNVAQDTYLMPFRLGQGRAFKDAGYDRDYQSEKKRDYGLVQKAVGNENIPIYSRVNNPEKRKELIQIYNPESTYNPNIKYPLIHAAFHPSSLYIDGTNGNIMYKGWDLNDYGTDKGGKGFSSYYGSIRKALANTLDVFGNPTVVTTGYQNVLDNNGKPMNIFKGNYKDDYNANMAASDFIVKQLLKKENPSFVNEYGMSPIPEVVITAPRKKHRLGGGLTSKDRGSSKHPYPSVSSKDFAGGGRSYPIPTKADAVDALRLAGLHGRSDVKTKVYSRYPELRHKARIGGSWKAPVYNTNKYRVSNRMRRQIATWEGSDFAGQNRRFKGDAIGAKERELRRMMGRTYNYLNDNQRDSLNSIYYNSRVDTFKNAFGKWFRNLNSAVDRGDERAFNNSLAGIRQSMTVGENRKGMSGLAKRRAWERNWFGNPIPMVSNETKAILKQQAEARMVQPTDNTRVVIQPEYIEVPAPVGHGVVPVDNPDPNLLQGNIKDNLINMGNKFRLGQRCGGSTRMRKALGGESRPVKGMRRKLAWGDVTYPYRRNNNFDYWDIIDQEQKANDKGGISPWTASNNYDVKVPYAITKSTPTIPYTSQVSTPTAKLATNTTIPTYTGNKSGMIIRDADWYGLGADLLSSIGGSILGLGAYKNLDFDYNLPNFVEESPVALNTTYHNEAQKSNVERNRLNSRNSILRNTMSGSTAVGRMQGVDTNALYQLNQLADEKTNKETELMNQNLLNEQQVRARNAAARNQYYNTVASIKNAAIQAKNEAELAKGQILSGSLQGIGNSFQNFISQGRQNYDDTQAMLMGVAASDYATPSRLLELGVDVGDDAALAGIYRSAMNIPNPGARPKREDYSDNTEYSYALTRWENQNKAYQRRNSYADLIKGRMSKKNLIKYGII